MLGKEVELRLVQVLLCLVIVIPGTHGQVAPLSVPPDFTFVLQYGRGHILDTVRGTFTRDGSIPQSMLTVNLKLTPTELAEVYRSLVAIDFWDVNKYPEIFAVPRQPTGTVLPGGTEYTLTVISRGTTKRLRWHDTVFNTYKPADDLRALFTKIRLMVESKPEYKNLPPSDFLDVN